jgi:hypothetical protein
MDNFCVFAPPEYTEGFSMNANFYETRDSELADRPPIPVEDQMPAKDRWVLIFTPTYRCLAYQERGVWRDVMHGQRISDSVLAWRPVD